MKYYSTDSLLIFHRFLCSGTLTTVNFCVSAQTLHVTELCRSEFRGCLQLGEFMHKYPISCAREIKIAACTWENIMETSILGCIYCSYLPKFKSDALFNLIFGFKVVIIRIFTVEVQLNSFKQWSGSECRKDSAQSKPQNKKIKNVLKKEIKWVLWLLRQTFPIRSLE